jgi:asparagine synthetase B (glutamine-hydrolysing)
MSGICGIAGASASLTRDDVISTMLLRIKHRGPDRSNCYTSDGVAVALGHNQLNAFLDRPAMVAPGWADTPGVAVAIDGCVTNGAAIWRPSALRTGRVATTVWPPWTVRLRSPYGTR